MKTYPHLILGIDPGFKGGLAIYDPQANDLVAVHRMPTVTQDNKLEIDEPELATLIGNYALQIQFAAFEKVHAFPGQGVTSMFRFGKATGIVQGIISSFTIPIYPIAPQVWKLKMGLSSDKDASRHKAQILFPQHKEKFEKKRDDGIAEAALIAVFSTPLFRQG